MVRPQPTDYALQGAAFDNSDPFTYARLATHERVGLDQQWDFSRSRRTPAPIEHRFTLKGNAQ
jgi:hypothetical protein